MDQQDFEQFVSEAYRKDKNDPENLKKIYDFLSNLLEWKFSMKIWWIFEDGEAREIFDFLRSKKRTCKMCLNQNGEYTIEAIYTDRDFLGKHLKELLDFNKRGYTFEDTKKIINIFEGGIQINTK